MTSTTFNLLYALATSAACLTGLILLNRSRRARRLRTIAAVLLILISSAIITLGPALRRHGWPAAIPDALLVSGWLVTPEEWSHNDLLSNPMLAELRRRLNAGELDIHTAAAWSQRVTARLDQYTCCFGSPRDHRLTTSDRICYLTATGTGLAGLPLLIWSLRGDRARSRQRCPRCWYNMHGAPSLTCPECGHTARRAAHLARTRRRWRSAFVSCCILTLASATAIIPTIRAKGWRGSVPDAVLVTVWPISPQEWIDYTLGETDTPPTGMLAELQRRLYDDELSHWAGSRWASRIDAHLRRNGVMGVDEVSPVLVRLRNARITRDFTDQPLDGVLNALGNDIGLPVRVQWDALCSDILPSDRVSLSLTSASGEDAFSQLFKSHFSVALVCDTSGLVVCPAEDAPRHALHLDLTDMITSMQTHQYRLAAVDSHDDHADIVTREDFRSCIQRSLTAMIDPDNWIDGGGETGRLFWIGDHLFVFYTARNIDAIRSLVSTLAPDAPASARSSDPDEWTASRDTLSLLNRTSVRLPTTSPTAREIATAVTAATGVPVDLEWARLITNNLADQPVFDGPTATTAAEALTRMTDWHAQPPYSRTLLTWTVWHGAVRILDDHYADPARTPIRTYDVPISSATPCSASPIGRTSTTVKVISARSSPPASTPISGSTKAEASE